MDDAGDESNEPRQRSWLFTGPFDKRLAFFTDTMRAISRHRDPQELVADYYRRMYEAFPTDGYLAVSRRDLSSPKYKITRSSTWGIDFNPWLDGDTKPLFDRGLLGKLIYEGQPAIFDDLRGAYEPDDPAAEYLDGMRSMTAVPMFDDGESLNMVVFLLKEPNGFDRDRLPDQVWVHNLFGRATNTLVLRKQIAKTNHQLRDANEAVGKIQKTLLPERLPEITGVRLGTFYDSSEQAGGDYYDFFEIPGGKLGIFMGDVSGHGTPAAVLMAVVHAIAHAIENPPHPDPPGRLLAHLNHHLCERYTRRGGTFVTAWYGILDPKTRKLTFANAGHPPPRLKHDNTRDDDKAGKTGPLVAGRARSLPLGIDPHETFPEGEVQLESGDVLVAYTDGITEAREHGGRGMWGIEGLDASLSNCRCGPKTLIDDLIQKLTDYTGGSAPEDDRTIVTAKLD
ncbi:MAG: GAF domain-containing SpoIIE family protein phosphatase [Planctomycetota bacterium]